MVARSRLAISHAICLSLLLAISLFSARPAAGQCTDLSCGRSSCATPAKPVSQALWGDLQPVDPSPLPIGRDSTAFDEFGAGNQRAYSFWNWYFGLDISNGYLFGGLSHGIQIWDIRSNPANPTLLSQLKQHGIATAAPYWAVGEEKWPFRDIDVPDGSDNVAIMAGKSDVGLVVYNTSDKSSPRPVYQNNLKEGEDVYAVKIGNTQYGFLAASGIGGGLYAYNLTNALQSSVACLESTPSEPAQCPGVFLGRIGTRTQVSFVSGVGSLVALSSGSTKGFEIWDVSNPANPQLRLASFSDRAVYGHTMWQEGNKTYLATRHNFGGAAILDVSCAASGTCSGTPPILWSKTGLEPTTPSFYATFSRASGGVPFLYLGSDNRCTGGTLQREYLLDVSNPSNPVDITPPARLLNGQLTSYWGWYYRGSATGFNLVMPRTGQFNGDYFYRAGLSIFDIHKRTTASAPAVDFEYSPLEIYPGDPVNFSDRSSGSPSSWSWSFPGGSPSSAVVQNPSGVTFSSPGSVSVSLTAQNGVGSGNRTKSLSILDPAPQVESVSVSPASPIVCQPVTFTANNPTGKQPLVYNWSVVRTDSPSNPPVSTGSGKSFTWATTGIASGTYTATVTVSGVGTATKSASVSLGALSTLPSVFAPTFDPFTSGTVRFHVAAAGATEWNWDFGDGNGFTGWTNDPVAGPNPEKVYTTTGSKTVRVKVRNCVEGEKTSSDVTVNVTQTTPLAASFGVVSGAFCLGASCSADAGQAITFRDLSTGAELWDFDWNGDGDFTDPGDQLGLTASAFTVVNGERRIQHTYSTAGEYAAKLRVRRGASEQSQPYSGPSILVGNPTNPNPNPGGASISVSCSPRSVAIGAAVSCTASATGCNASSNGWNWSTGGGTTSGGASSAVSITWASAGSKSIAVTNSACGSAVGINSITVTSGSNPDPGTPTGTLGAQFAFTPTAPTTGQAVSFDASSSTGNPESYTWAFGDNTAGTGRNATHTYAAAGNYVVRLTVVKQGTGANCFFGTCASEITKVVVVGGGTPPPPTVSAEFTATAECISQFGFNFCQAPTGQTVTLTATATDATTYSWSFGDGGTATGRSVTHAWAAAGEFTVTLTVTKGSSTATQNRQFTISGGPVASIKSIVLPWIAQSRGALNQSSDLYVHNPGTAPMDVAIEFRKRGTPETNPPKVNRTIQPGATLFVEDALRELFNRENVAGFITALVDGPVEPVVTSFNTTVQADGSQFGQTVPGISMSRSASQASATGAATATQVQHLVGLNDNAERLAYFGLSNPSETPAVFRLRFFDHLGQQIGQTGNITLSRFGQQQFQVQRIRDEFHVANEDDYRVQIESEGSPIFPYAANLRIASDDPSFVGGSTSSTSKVYLIGALSSPGINNSLWQSDVVLSNISNQVVLTDMTFTRVGAVSVPTQKVRLTLQPGETQRLDNAIASKWGIRDGVGVLTLESDSPNDVFPIVQGESYENSRPSRRFGQSMTAFSERDAAGPGQTHLLVGLRQDNRSRTTLWLFNPGSTNGDYDIVYRALDGTVIGRIDHATLGAGKMRQISPSQHPIPAAGVQGGFTVQVVVRSGKVLGAAQVINNATNDPAYIEGKSR